MVAQGISVKMTEPPPAKVEMPDMKNFSMTCAVEIDDASITNLTMSFRIAPQNENTKPDSLLTLLWPTPLSQSPIDITEGPFTGRIANFTAIVDNETLKEYRVTVGPVKSYHDSGNYSCQVITASSGNESDKFPVNIFGMSN